MPPQTSSLDNPDYANFAWGRYRALMLWMVLASTLAVVLGLGLLWFMAGPVPWQMLALTAGGVFFSVMLAAALMGLVFLSSGSGHDDSVADPLADVE